MTAYDAVMAGLLVAGMVWGAWRGIVWQVASISSLLVGYAVAHQLSPQLAPHFPGEPVVARGEAMLAIYAAVSGAIFLGAWLVRSTLRKLRFEAFDRHLGMIMGGIEGALLGLVGTLFVVTFDQPLRAPIFASPTGQIVSRVLDSVGPALPDEAREALAPFLNGSEGRGTVAASTESSTPAADPAPAAAKLENLIEEGESRLGRAIVETAEKGLQQTGVGNDRAAARERR
jgi:membrane protein required for colicin V production